MAEKTKTARKLKIIIATLVVGAVVVAASSSLQGYFFLLLLGCDMWSADRMHASDDDFVLRHDRPSHDGRFRLLLFQYDTGALGYSRKFWAVVPANYEGLNLSKYILPDGYRGIGWSEGGELIVQEWEPYYFIGRQRDLKTGDVFKGVPLIVRELPEREQLEGDKIAGP